MKRTILALCLLSFPFPSLPTITDLGAKGILKLALKISQGACELVKDSVEAGMGLAALKKPVKIGIEPSPTTSSIGLKNCSEVVKAYVAMDGTLNADDPNLFVLDAGGAMGVGLKTKTSAGVQQFPKNVTPALIESAINGDGAHQLNYIASYVPLCADATVGRVDATIDFTVQYE